MQVHQSVVESRQAGFFRYASMPGYQEQEYQLVWSIPDAVKEKVRKVRAGFQEKYPLPFGPGQQVVLPLVKFRQRQLLEERIKQSIYQLATGWRPIQVRLQDFAALPSHSIYVPVAARSGSSGDSGLAAITRELRSIQSLLRLDKEHTPYFITAHKILVAGKLPAQVFDKAWPEYAQKAFSAQFLADACLLLKRSAGNPNWQIIQRVELRNLPVGVKQQSLFEA